MGGVLGHPPAAAARAEAPALAGEGHQVLVGAPRAADPSEAVGADILWLLSGGADHSVKEVMLRLASY
jgi:hypothetical protein